MLSTGLPAFGLARKTRLRIKHCNSKRRAIADDAVSVTGCLFTCGCVLCNRGYDELNLSWREHFADVHHERFAKQNFTEAEQV